MNQKIRIEEPDNPYIFGAEVLHGGDHVIKYEKHADGEWMLVEPRTITKEEIEDRRLIVKEITEAESHEIISHIYGYQAMLPLHQPTHSTKTQTQTSDT